MERFTTQLTICADVVGAFWWPMGEEWRKDCETFDVTAYQRRCVNGGRGSRGITLREALSGMESEHLGDSSNGVTFSGELIVTIRNGSRSRSRSFPLNMFPSIADMVESSNV
jgi:hypothetical protein